MINNYYCAKLSDPKLLEDLFHKSGKQVPSTNVILLKVNKCGSTFILNKRQYELIYHHDGWGKLRFTPYFI